MSLYDDMQEVFGPKKPKGVVPPELGQEVALTNAIRNGLMFHYQKQFASDVGGSLIDKIFSKGRDRGQELLKLEIIEKRRRLGLPENTEDYQELLNENKTLPDPGRALMWAGMALSRKPLLRFGASPVLKGEKHGSTISKLFRR